MSSRILRYAKFAEEADYAVVPASPQFTVDIGSTTVDVPSDTQLLFEGGIGRGIRLHQPGWYSPAGNVVYMGDVDTLAPLLKWTLGGYQFTSEGGAGDLNLHECWGARETILPSFTTWLGKDVFEQVVRGGVASQLQLQVSDGYLQATVDGLFSRDERGTLDEDVLASLPLPPPLTFPRMRLWVGGTGDGDELSAKVTDLTVTVNNNADAGAARGIGSRYAQRTIPAGQRDVTVGFTCWYDSTDHIERVWGSANGPSEDGSAELPIRLVGDSGDAGSITIDTPRGIVTGVSTQPSGRTRIAQQVSYRALLDTVTLEDATDVETDIYVRVENARPAQEAAA